MTWTWGDDGVRTSPRSSGFSIRETHGAVELVTLNKSRGLKRSLDVAIAGSVLLLASPAMLAIAAWIRFTMGSPVLFRQQRPGYKGRPFEITKFRTMRDSRGPDDIELTDTQRLTRLGDVLRRTGLDELPELWNVLRGEMSIVGPRPLLMEYLDRYSPEEARRHDVPPGISGWAQVHGRRSLDMPDRLKLDVWYVDNWSIGLDLRIMARTISTLVSGAGSRTHDPVADPQDPWSLGTDDRPASRSSDEGSP